MEKEIWKWIPGYENLYEVSNYGNVRSYFNNKWGTTNEAKIKTLTINNRGYYYVNLSKNGKYKPFTVHKLVAMTFINHKKDSAMGIVINHIDNNKLNNHVSNLEWVTQRYNTQCHKTDVGVYFNKNRNKWYSQIQIKNKDIHLGCFKDKNDALKTYQIALLNINKYDGDNKEFRKLINGD